MNERGKKGVATGRFHMWNKSTVEPMLKTPNSRGHYGSQSGPARIAFPSDHIDREYAAELDADVPQTNSSIGLGERFSTDEPVFRQQFGLPYPSQDAVH